MNYDDIIALDDARKRLYLNDYLTDSENEKIRKRIDKTAKKIGLKRSRNKPARND